MSHRSPNRRQPPEPTGSLRPFTFPEFRRRRLGNGLRLYTAHLPRAPLVSITALLPAGAQYDTLGHPGVASLHGFLLDDGGERRSAYEIAAAVEALGGLMSSSTGWNMAYVELGVLARHFDAALELVAESIRYPGFPEEEFERLRRRRSAEILRRRDQPRKLAEQLHDAVVYRGTVYGQPMSGTTESLATLDRDQIVDFHRRHRQPEDSALLVVGDLDESTVEQRLEATWGDWCPEAVPRVLPRIDPAPRSGLEVLIVERPKAPQTELIIGHVGIARNDPDFEAVRVLNALLGGMFTSRLNLNLRERHGFTYSAQSNFAFRQGPGPFRARAAVANDAAGRAVTEILGEMRRLRDEPVDEAELRHVQGYLVDIFPYTLQTIDDLAKRLEGMAAFDLPDDYFKTYPACLWDLSSDDILEVARRRLHPDSALVVATGDSEALRPQLEHLGPVRVVTPEQVLRGEVDAGG